MSIDAVMVLLLLLQKKFKFDPITEYLYGTIPVPYKYSEITTGAVPRYHTGINFFDSSSFFIFIFGYGTSTYRYHIQK